MLGKVMVTGASGLIGNTVRQRLEARGTEVVAIDLHARADTAGPVTECDLGDAHRLHALAGQGVTGIIHCGAYSGPMVARDNPFDMVQVNIVGTAHLLEVARVHGMARFVYCSSTSAYGSTEGVVPEDVPMHPSTVYGASKVASEQLVATYRTQYGVDGTSLRLSWVYGPRRTTDCLIRELIQQARRKQPSHIAYGADFTRQYINVEDAAGGLIAAFDHDHLPRPVYNVTGGRRLTLGEVADRVKAVFPDADISFGAGGDPFDDRQGLFDIAAAQADFGYVPTIDLETGIRRYAAWLETQGL